MSELTWLSARELAGLIRERRASAVEVLDAHLARIERHNPALNAIVTLDAEGTRRAAREADVAMRRGDVRGPLHGVPVTLKDCHATAGMRTTAGHPPLADYVPAADGTIAARLRAAGALVVGKTNVSELLTSFQTDNPVFGRTNNQWDLARTPGGSSGGAAAALAAGLTPLDIGSDIGGSIRIPAHCCGVYGLKPTEHRVPNTGHIPDLPAHPRSTRIMNACGPMARDIGDLELAFGLIAGPDGRDSDVPPVPVRPAPAFDVRELRIAWSADLPGWPVSADVRGALARLASTLDGLGARVEEAPMPVSLDEQVELRLALRAFVRVFRDEPPPGGPLRVDDYFRTLHARDAVIAAWEAFLAGWDAYLCPIAATSAIAHCPRGTPLPVDGTLVEHDRWAAACVPFNLTGHPALAMPIGLGSDGMPIGAQFVGPRWQDERLLGVARAIADVAGRFQRPRGYET